MFDLYSDIQSFDNEYEIVDIGQHRIFSDDYSGIGEPLCNRDAAINWMKKRIKNLKNESITAKKMNNIIAVKSIENEIWKLKREAAKRFFMVFYDSDLSSIEEFKLKRLASKCKRLYKKNKKALSKDDINEIIKLKKFLKNKLVENKCISFDYPEDLIIIQRKKIIPGYIERRINSLTFGNDQKQNENPIIDFSEPLLGKLIMEEVQNRIDSIDEKSIKKFIFTHKK